jgi:hypothetical protein
MAAGCAAPRPARLDPADVVWPQHETPRFAATGRVRLESSRGDVDGRIVLRVDPPRRVWLELRADALFGLVGERVVVCLPGDGWLVTYEERAQRLERVPFSESWLADLAPGGDLARLLQLASARLPWPAAAAPPAPRLDDDRLVVDLAPTGARGFLRIEPGPHVFRRLEWRLDHTQHLEVEYGPAQPCGAGWLPERLRGRGRDLKVDLRLDRIEPRDGFEPGDFDIEGTARAGDG